MAALTAAAIIGAVAATASAANSIEQSNQARRSANQAANGARQDAESAMRDKAVQDQTAVDQRAANLARDNQRRRIASGGVGMMAPPGAAVGNIGTPTLMGSAPTSSVSGGNTLLGS